MKKTLAILLVLVLGMTVLFTGCGSGSDEAAGGDGTEPTLKVGYIFIGAINDGGFTQSMYEGAMKAEEELGGQIETKYIENVSDGDISASTDAAMNLIDQGCNVIVGCSYGYMDALEALANSGDYDDVTFLHFSGNKMNDTNFDNWFGSMEQARYLTGMAAASVAKNGVLGYVAAHPYTEVQIGINAFTLGAQAVNPDVEVKVVYIGTWGDAEIEKTAAEQLIQAGAEVVCYHADSTATQVAAAEAGDVYAIGWNYPQNDCGDLYLTAAYWNTAAYFIPTFQSIMDGTFKPQSYYGTMADGLIAIDELSDAIPDDVKAKIEDTKAKMEAGEFEVFTGPIKYNDGSVLCEEGQTLDRAGIWSINKEVEGVTAISK
ncbi:MAG: BMP family ABC transporter substrate-binding protein [Firmicutes bacterium]|nr:BMP family ABC transporter substrate-binding protein [Bacillota bacterium]